GLLRARISGNEASAIGSMRAVNTAQQNYSQLCQGYSVTLQDLKTAGNYLSPDLTGAAPVVKSGFTVKVAAAAAGVAIPNPPAACTTPMSNFYAPAIPLSSPPDTLPISTYEAGTIFYTPFP